MDNTENVVAPTTETVPETPTESTIPETAQEILDSEVDNNAPVDAEEADVVA